MATLASGSTGSGRAWFRKSDRGCTLQHMSDCCDYWWNWNDQRAIPCDTYHARLGVQVEECCKILYLYLNSHPTLDDFWGLQPPRDTFQAGSSPQPTVRPATLPSQAALTRRLAVLLLPCLLRSYYLVIQCWLASSRLHS
jgi:hypothetical protein